MTIVYTSVIILMKIIFDFPGSELTGWASIIGITGFIGGLNLMILGILGEYLLHIFEATRNQPAYLIEEKNLRGN